MTVPSSPALDTGTRLAVDRTRLAYERTMMAWIRTAASLISFGFTIYKFFELEVQVPERAGRLIGARGFALMLILTGLVALLLAGLQHRESLKLMRQMYGVLPRSVSGPVAGLVGLLGVLAFAGVLLRV
jgi:putative membrane protein